MLIDAVYNDQIKYGVFNLVNSRYESLDPSLWARISIDYKLNNTTIPSSVVNQYGDTVEFSSAFKEYVAGGNFINFGLTRVTESFAELSQITPLISGKFNANFFGQEPSIFRYYGFVYHVNSMPYKSMFHALYDLYFRGTSALANKSLVRLEYGATYINGVMLRAEFSQDANAASSVYDFSFDFLVTKFMDKEYGIGSLPNEIVVPTTITPPEVIVPTQKEG